MIRKIARLFIVKNRVEACFIIYALALGAISRGTHYLEQYPGFGGHLLFLACMGAVVLAGAKMLDGLRYERERAVEGSRGVGPRHKKTEVAR
jgi:hypothetical protein